MAKTFYDLLQFFQKNQHDDTTLYHHPGESNEQVYYDIRMDFIIPEVDIIIFGNRQVKMTFSHSSMDPEVRIYQASPLPESEIPAFVFKLALPMHEVIASGFRWYDCIINGYMIQAALIELLVTSPDDFAHPIENDSPLTTEQVYSMASEIMYLSSMLHTAEKMYQRYDGPTVININIENEYMIDEMCRDANKLIAQLTRENALDNLSPDEKTHIIEAAATTKEAVEMSLKDVRKFTAAYRICQPE